MKLQDLNREQLMLLKTDFPEDIEKHASAIVGEEIEKFAEMEDVAAGCMQYGADLAMQKIAEMEEKYKEMKEEGKKEDKKEDEEDESEEEKNASGMASFICESYWRTMMEKGAEYYGDPKIYLEELCKEAGVDKTAADLLGKLKPFLDAAKSKGSEALGKGKAFAKGRYGKNSEGRDYLRQAMGKSPVGASGGKRDLLPGGSKMLAAGAAAKKYAPELAGSAGLLAGGMYASKKK